MDSDRNLAANLKYLRTQLKLSQEQMASRAHVSQSTVSNIERGRVSATTDVIDRLGRTLGVEPWVLLLPNEYLTAKGPAAIISLNHAFEDVPGDQHHLVSGLMEALAR
jgi:transcriptional regulator with XRE-family HTH domain